MGDGVAGFREGDRVFGTIGAKGTVHHGTFAELSTPLAPALALTPAAIDDQQAGALGVAATTAMSAVEAIDPSEGATVLIVGATGGVGTFAIQLGAARGAHVIASVMPGDEDVVTELGAAETVDYSNDVIGAVRERHPDGIDAVIDLVHRDPGEFGALVGLVRAGGAHPRRWAGGRCDRRSVRCGCTSPAATPPTWAHAGFHDQEGTLKAAIQRTYPLAEAAQALADFTNKHTVGKLVLRCRFPKDERY